MQIFNVSAIFFLNIFLLRNKIFLFENLLNLLVI